MFLTTQHPSLLTNPYHDDSTMQQLYAIARHVFHDQVTKHQRICDDILDLCRDTKTTFEEALSLLRQDVTDAQARIRLEKILQDGLLKSETYAKNYARAEESSPMGTAWTKP
jgi:DNA-directed RNA polymerase specialized sigma24 family protein